MTAWTRRTSPALQTPLAQARVGLIEPMRNVYGVSDKVLAMAMSGILIGAADVRPRWLEVGVHLIAVDTLVHNFLHRTGILAGSRPPIHTGPAVTGQAAAPTLSGWSPARSTLGSSTVLSRRSSPGSCNSRSGGIAASKASTSATATGSMTGIGAKTGIAAYTAFATEFA